MKSFLLIKVLLVLVILGLFIVVLFYLNTQYDIWINTRPQNFITLIALGLIACLSFVVGVLHRPKPQDDKHSFIITEKGLVLPKQDKIIALRIHTGDMIRVRLEEKAFGIMYNNHLYRTFNGEVIPMFRNYIQDGCTKQFTCKCKNKKSAKRCRFNRQSKAFKHRKHN